MRRKARVHSFNSSIFNFRLMGFLIRCFVSAWLISPFLVPNVPLSFLHDSNVLTAGSADF